MLSTDFLIERKILKIGNQLANTRSEDLKRHDLTASQSETLLFFAAQEGALVTDLKEHLKISHQAARNLVERMKLKDLLRVEISAEDGRAKQVFLTEKGHAVYGKLTEKGTSVGRHLLRGFTQEERAQLSLFLDKITENL